MKKLKLRNYVHSEGCKTEVDFELSLTPVAVFLTITCVMNPTGDDVTERSKTLASWKFLCRKINQNMTEFLCIL